MGCLVNCRVTSKYDSGVEVNFLHHFSGHIFIDHLKRAPKDYKKKDTFLARIIAIKQSSKLIALSELPHIVSFKRPKKLPVAPGDTFQNFQVSKQLAGSCLINL